MRICEDVRSGFQVSPDMAEGHLQVDLEYPQRLSFAGQTNVDLYVCMRVASSMFGANAFLGGRNGAWFRTLNL